MRLTTLPVVLLLPAMLAIPARGAFWEVDLVHGNGLGSGDTSLAIGPGGIPHVSYTADACVTVATKTVAGWDAQPVAYVGSWAGTSSLAIDAAGKPCVAFADGSGSTNWLKYACKPASTWTIESVQDLGWLADYVSLAVNGSGQACIAYTRVVTIDDSHVYLCFARRTGANTWLKQDVVEIGSTTGPALVFDASGAAHIAFCDSFSDKLRVATNASGSWTIEDVDGGIGGPALPYPAITLQPDGLPAVAYLLSTDTSSALKLARKTGSSWRIETAATLASTWMGHCSAAITPSGVPMICYQDPYSTSLKNAWRTDSTWLTEVIDAGMLTGARPSMKLDSLGNVDVSYFDNLSYNVMFAQAVAPTTLQGAKKLPDGQVVQVSGIVASTATEDLGNRIYAQDLDRIGGIQLRFPGVVPRVARGDVLDVQGTLTTVDGERAIDDPLVVVY